MLDARRACRRGLWPSLLGRWLSSTQVSSELQAAPVELQQACHLPMFADGVPVIGAAPDVPGAYVASGGGCWGILCGPATGLAMSELILDGAASAVDLVPFSPQRFR